MAIPPKKEDIVRIEMIVAPEQREKGEGLYEYRHMSDRYTLDIFDLERDLAKLKHDFKMNGTPEQVLDRLQNFKMVYINLGTGEVST